jgi:hypothetical protein
MYKNIFFIMLIIFTVTGCDSNIVDNFLSEPPSINNISIVEGDEKEVTIISGFDSSEYDWDSVKSDYFSVNGTGRSISIEAIEVSENHIEKYEVTETRSNGDILTHDLIITIKDFVSEEISLNAFEGDEVHITPSIININNEFEWSSSIENFTVVQNGGEFTLSLPDVSSSDNVDFILKERSNNDFIYTHKYNISIDVLGGRIKDYVSESGENILLGDYSENDDIEWIYDQLDGLSVVEDGSNINIYLPYVHQSSDITFIAKIKVGSVFKEDVYNVTVNKQNIIINEFKGTAGTTVRLSVEADDYSNPFTWHQEKGLTSLECSTNTNVCDLSIPGTIQDSETFEFIVEESTVNGVKKYQVNLLVLPQGENENFKFRSAVVDLNNNNVTPIAKPVSNGIHAFYRVHQPESGDHLRAAFKSNNELNFQSLGDVVDLPITTLKVESGVDSTFALWVGDSGVYLSVINKDNSLSTSLVLGVNGIDVDVDLSVSKSNLAHVLIKYNNNGNVLLSSFIFNDALNKGGQHSVELVTSNIHEYQSVVNDINDRNLDKRKKYILSDYLILNAIDTSGLSFKSGISSINTALVLSEKLKNEVVVSIPDPIGLDVEQDIGEDGNVEEVELYFTTDVEASKSIFISESGVDIFNRESLGLVTSLSVNNGFVYNELNQFNKNELFGFVDKEVKITSREDADYDLVSAVHSDGNFYVTTKNYVINDSINKKEGYYYFLNANEPILVGYNDFVILIDDVTYNYDGVIQSLSFNLNRLVVTSKSNLDNIYFTE